MDYTLDLQLVISGLFLLLLGPTYYTYFIISNCKCLKKPKRVGLEPKKGRFSDDDDTPNKVEQFEVTTDRANTMQTMTID